MPKLSQLASDLDLEVGGRRVVWERGRHRVPCRIARFGNSRFVQRVRALKPELAQLSSEQIAEQAEELEPIIKEGLAHDVLIEMEGLEDDEGKPIAYTPELGLRLLNDPQFEDLYRFILEESQKAGKYLVQVKDEAAGN